MTREEQMMTEADAYAAGAYADEPVCFSTEEAICETINDFVAGWRAADAHPQWIPVEERLPAFGQEVLVYAETRNEKSKLNFNAIFYSWRAFSTRLMASDRTDVRDFMLYFLGSRMDFRGFHITHWMPLPAAPRKEDKK